MCRSLICIACGRIDEELVADLSRRGWSVTVVEQLAQAERQLQAVVYMVGLLMLNRKPRWLDEVDALLRRHGNVHWVGAFRSEDLTNRACRELITDCLCDFHTLPIDLERLAATLGHAYGLMALRCPVRNAEVESGEGAALVGRSMPMRHRQAQIERVARVVAPVLLWGESGTGKELVARSVHARSSRAGKPFVPVNCGALAPELVHAELFGYERGAFTGAASSKPGLIESAEGGTLFLDEIGDMPRDVQANLLRFLQEKSTQRLGSARARAVDVRVIAASHVHLEEAVTTGAFRLDLFHRLAVLPLTVPPLRARGDDVVVLAEHFRHLFAHEASQPIAGFSDAALRAIASYHWPGNVRELINRVRRALVMAEGYRISPLDLGFEHRLAVSPARTAPRVSNKLAALHVSLERNGYNVSRAARDLGISRTTAYRLLESGDGRRTSSTDAANSAVASTRSDACGIGSEL